MSTQTGSISFESTQGLQSYAKQNYATLSQIKGQFATCGTGASTAAKVATIVPEDSGWSLYTGATVTVKFTSANTAGTPTLNVNGSGAKQIRDYAGNALTEAAYKWLAGSAIALTYDGTYWRIQDSNLMERVHSAETAIEQTATSITSLASMNDTYTQPDGTTATNTMKSYVNQTAEGITQNVSSTYATKTELANASSAAELTKLSTSQRVIVTEDAAKLPLIDLTVYGESVQDGTPTPSAPIYIQAVRGKNLIQLKPGLVASHLESGNEYMAINVGQSYMDIPSGSNVRVSFDIEMIVNTANPTIQIYNTNNKGPKQISNVGVSFTAAAGTIIKQRVVAPVQTIIDRNDATLSYNVIEFYATYNTGNVFAISNLQLEYGTVAHEFIPYGQIAITAVEKNLYNQSFYKLKQGNWRTWNAGTIASDSNYACTDLLPCSYISGQTITLNKRPGGSNPGFAFYDKTATYLTGFANNGSTAGTPWTITIPENAFYMSFTVPAGETDIQLELGTESTVYKPYKEYTVYLDLKGNELHGLDETYRDQLDIDASGHAVITKRTGVFKVSDLSFGTLTQSNNATYKHIAGTGKPSDIVYPSATTQKINALTTRFVPYTQAGAWSPGLVVGYNNEAIYFTVATSVADKTEFLSSYGDTEIIYALIESAWYTIDLGYIDLPQVTDNSTVYVAAEVQPIIDGSWWTKAGYSVGRLSQQTKENQGSLEAPYTEVEWVESNGTQYVYLDWKPPIATWGFDIDFQNKNAVTTSVGAWRSDTNVNGYGTIFGTRNASNVNNAQLSSYNNGVVRVTGNSNTSNHGFKTDKTRQHMSYIGTTFTKPNGTTMTVNRGSETANKPYANMVIFACHEGVRRAGTGYLIEPSTTRIYSLKFYENTEVVVDLVGAIRNKDGMTGLYDKVKNHFYPAPDMTYGNAVGVLGKIDTLTEAVAKKNIQVRIDNRAVSRMWEANIPELDRLEDGQQITVNFTTAIGSTTPDSIAAAGITGFTGWDETATTAYYNVYLKLTLKDGSKTEWIPCFYSSGSRLTTHYGAGTPILLTYRENVFYNATTTSAGTGVMRAWYCDPNYTDGNTTYTKYSDTVIAGKNGLKRYTLCMKDDEGNWTSITTTANNVNVTGKSAYTGGLQLGNILYHITNADYAAGANGGVLWESYGGIDFRYSVNGVQNAAATELQLRKPVYLVGTLGQDGLFYLDTTKWWTQTEPTTEDGKIYILIGTSYNSYYLIFLAANNPTYEYRNGKFQEFAYSRITKNATDIVQTNENITLSATSTLNTAKEYADGLIATEVNERNSAITLASNAITSEVSKISSAKYVNSSTASWTLANIKTYAADDNTARNWNVTSTTGLRVGDTVYVKGTDSTRNCPVYIKTTVTAINSTTQFAGKSHGYEDVLPVETIKSTINQSADSIKIAANHIEIDGTTTFKNNNTTTTLSNYLNANYDAAGSAQTVANNAALKTDAVSRTQRIYYRQTASGAKPGINETWLATSGTGYGNWSLTVPQLTSGSTKYPKLYTAVQTQTVAQQAAGSACSCSPVQLDDSTTIIDGGNIITGSVSANSIDANSGTFNTANIPNLNASKITAGDIAADRIKTNVISAINSLTAGQIDAARIKASDLTVGESQVTNLTSDLVEAKKHTQVIISATNVNYVANTCTLTARLYIDGVLQTATTLKWQWYMDGAAQGNQTTGDTGILSVTSALGIAHRYSCKCTF